MFLHNFKYSLKTLFRNKTLIFWTFAFPIILGTLFNLAFKDIEKNEMLEIIDIAVVDNSEFENNTYFKESLKTLSDKSNENQLFNIKYTSLEKSKELLDKKKITAYLLFQNSDVKIVVNSKGINETITRFVVDDITSQQEMITSLTAEQASSYYKTGKTDFDYQKVYKDVINLVNQNSIKLNNISNSNLSYTMIEYYTLLAMACLYGAMISIFITNKKSANITSAGKRTTISPVHKKTMLLSSFIASYIVQMIGILIIFLYTIFVLKVDYGNNIPLVILLLSLGSLAGLNLGIAIGTLLKANETTKTGILISITMLFSFLSGMMGITMKYVIDNDN